MMPTFAFGKTLAAARLRPVVVVYAMATVPTKPNANRGIVTGNQHPGLVLTPGVLRTLHNQHAMPLLCVRGIHPAAIRQIMDVAQT